MSSVITESEDGERLPCLLRLFPDAVFLMRAGDGALLDVNEAFEKLTGYLRLEIVGDTFQRLNFWLDPCRWGEVFRELETKGEVCEFETKIQRKDGRLAYVLMSMRRVESGGHACLLAVARDVTERKSAERRAREREERMKSALDTLLSPDREISDEEVGQIIDFQAVQELMNFFYETTRIGVGIIDLKGNILVATGWQEICTRFHRVHPETSRYCLESDVFLSASVEQGKYVKYKCRNNMWDMSTPIVVGGRHIANLFLGQFFLEEEIPDYEVFERQAEQYGFDKKEYLAALQRVPRWSGQTVASAMDFYTQLAGMISKLSYRNLQLSKLVMKQNLIEVQLLESRAMLQSIIDNSAAVIYLKDLQGRYLLINRRHEELFHVSREAIVGQTDYDVFPVELARPFVAFDRQALAAGGAMEAEEVTLLHDDGPHTYVSVKAPLLDAAGDPYAICGISTDITERKRDEQEIRRLNEELWQKIEQLQDAQEELVRSEKLAILGQLSGSVGHELRNPLGVMNNAVYFLKMVLSEADEPVKEYLEIIGKEIGNSLRIITDLLDFARTRMPQAKAVTARELVEESLGKCAIPENVELAQAVPQTLPPLRVDPLQMVQVLQNLIVNAIQAMPAGGTLTIRGAPEGEGMVRLEVADTGQGIHPEHMNKIFQPLFTTKAKGIGLGLVLCKNLVEANGGRIEAASRPGMGAAFAVILPVEKDSA